MICWGATMQRADRVSTIKLDKELSHPPFLLVYRADLHDLLRPVVSRICFSYEYPTDASTQRVVMRDKRDLERVIFTFKVLGDQDLFSFFSEAFPLLDPVGFFPLSLFGDKYREVYQQTIDDLEFLLSADDKLHLNPAFEISLLLSKDLKAKVTRLALESGLLETLENVYLGPPGPPLDKGGVPDDSLRHFMKNFGDLLRRGVKEKHIDPFYWLSSVVFGPFRMHPENSTEDHPLLDRSKDVDIYSHITFRFFGNREYELSLFYWLCDWLEQRFPALVKDEDYFLKHEWYSTGDPNELSFCVEFNPKSGDSSRESGPPCLKGFYVTLESKAEIPYPINRRTSADRPIAAVTMSQLVAFVDEDLSMESSFNEAQPASSLSEGISKCYEEFSCRKPEIYPVLRALNRLGESKFVHPVAFIYSLNDLFSSVERYRRSIAKRLTFNDLSLSLMDLIPLDPLLGNERLGFILNPSNLSSVRFCEWLLGSGYGFVQMVKQLQRDFPELTKSKCLEVQKAVADALKFLLQVMEGYLSRLSGENNYSFTCSHGFNLEFEIGFISFSSNLIKSLKVDTLSKSDGDIFFHKLGAQVIFRF